MLLCAIDQVEPGAEVAAPVYHPRRPEVELLEGGVLLDARLIRRLKELGVTGLWITHDATSDLDQHIDPHLGKGRRVVYERLKEDFTALERSTVTAGHVQTYRQVVMELVCELMSNHRTAHLAEQMLAGPPGMFTHSANVAYLSVLAGLHMRQYIAQSRARLSAEHAQDVTNLGLGAMLHDIGKVGLDRQLAGHHVLDEPEDEGDRKTYRDHAELGYEMLRGSRTPASATQIVLNHHQRWDGSGFPDLSGVTGDRRSGTQQGQEIHVFNRIVAAADVLDHLLGTNDAGRSARPAVAALQALAGDRFDGWFDPQVRDTVLRSMPPFAMGLRVTLSDGRPAVVVSPCMKQPCRPIVRLLGEADRQPDGQYPSLDLMEHPGLHIAECGGHDVTPYLFELPEAEAKVAAAG